MAIVQHFAVFMQKGLGFSFCVSLHFQQPMVLFIGEN
jgi:hypothetical protein